jgi:hypothetical protein
MPDPDEVRSRTELIAFVQKLMNAIYRDQRALERQIESGGVAVSALNHTMLDALDGLVAWLDDGFDPDNPHALAEPSDQEVWHWVAICLAAAAEYE